MNLSQGHHHEHFSLIYTTCLCTFAQVFSYIKFLEVNLLVKGYVCTFQMLSPRNFVLIYILAKNLKSVHFSSSSLTLSNVFLFFFNWFSGLSMFPGLLRSLVHVKMPIAPLATLLTDLQLHSFTQQLLIKDVPHARPS